MRTPERLVYGNEIVFNGSRTIEALFVDEEQPIHCLFRLEEGERSFEALVYSTNEGSADFFSPEELFLAFESLEQEENRKTEAVLALIDQCREPGECNE